MTSILDGTAFQMPGGQERDGNLNPTPGFGCLCSSPATRSWCWEVSCVEEEFLVLCWDEALAALLLVQMAEEPLPWFPEA